MNPPFALRNILPAFIVLHLGLTAVQAAPTRQWNHGNPSNEEQHALEVFNRFRRDHNGALDLYLTQSATNEVLASSLLTTTRLPNTAAAIASLKNSIATVAAASNEVRDTAPLAFYPLFKEVAQSKESAFYKPGTGSIFRNPPFQIPSRVPKIQLLIGDPSFVFSRSPQLSGQNATGGTATVKGSSEGGPGQVSIRGETTFAANLYSPSVTAREFIVTNAGGIFTSLLRKANTQENNFANVTYGTTRMIGVHISSPKTDADFNGARILTAFMTDNEAFSTSDLPFGNANTAFIVGVVYRDENKDGEYSPGEGLGGVTITPSNGDWFAVTSASGGYAIPVRTGSGAYSLTASGNGVDSSTTVTVGSSSVSADFVLQSTKPAQQSVPASSGSTTLVNLSTRGLAETGENAMFGGFVIRGTVKKRLLIRGVGFSLRSYGIQLYLAKPLLTLFDADGRIVTSRKTQDTYVRSGDRNVVAPEIAAASQSSGAFALNIPTLNTSFRDAGIEAPKFSGDTAMVVELDPGLYSLRITPDTDTPADSMARADNGTYPNASSGVVLLEVYDLQPNNAASIVNLSTRGKITSQVPAGGNARMAAERQMIVGVVLSGNGARRLLVRGVSPTLSSFGIQGTLDDPAMRVFNAAGEEILVNDDWGVSAYADQVAALGSAAGAFALPPLAKDSATLIRVSPGLYSVGIRPSSGNTTGVAIAEVYTTDE
jgi:hypothetical protein